MLKRDATQVSVIYKVMKKLIGRHIRMHPTGKWLLITLTGDMFKIPHLSRQSVFFVPEYHDTNNKLVNRYVHFRVVTDYGMLKFIAFDEAADILCKTLSDDRHFELFTKPLIAPVFNKDGMINDFGLFEVKRIHIGGDRFLFLNPGQLSIYIKNTIYTPGDKTFGYAVVQCVV